jgi:hypothetical protein
LSTVCCFRCSVCSCFRRSAGLGSVHGRQLLLERHHLCGVSSQLLEQRPQLPANPVPVRPGKHRAQRRVMHRSACLHPRPWLLTLRFTQPALLALGRRRPARLLASRRLLGFGHRRLPVTSPFVLRADSVREVRLRRRVPDPAVRAFVACALFACLTRLFARRPWPVRQSTNDSINLLRYEAMPRIGVQ